MLVNYHSRRSVRHIHIAHPRQNARLAHCPFHLFRHIHQMRPPARPHLQHFHRRSSPWFPAAPLALLTAPVSQFPSISRITQYAGVGHHRGKPALIGSWVGRSVLQPSLNPRFARVPSHLRSTLSSPPVHCPSS